MENLFQDSVKKKFLIKIDDNKETKIKENVEKLTGEIIELLKEILGKLGTNVDPIFLLNSLKPKLEQYVNSINHILNNIQNEINECSEEHLAVIGKLNHLIAFLNKLKTDELRLKDEYPFVYKNQRSKKNLDIVHSDILKIEEKVRSLFLNKNEEKIKTPSPTLEKNKSLHFYYEEERKELDKDKAYTVSEQDLERNLQKLFARYESGKKQVLKKLQSNIESNNTTHPNEYFNGKQTEETKAIFNAWSKIMFKLIYDINNLVNFYRNHLSSITHLKYSISSEEKVLLDNLTQISSLVNKYVQVGKVPFMKQVSEQLYKLNQNNINVHHRSERTKSVRPNDLKNRIIKTKNESYANGFSGKIQRFKFPVGGSRFLGGKGVIAAEMFVKDIKRIPSKAVIITPGFSGYRQFFDNIAAYFAEFNYLVVIIDIPLQGESRGMFGYPEMSENIMRTMRFLKTKYSVQKIALVGHSMGATASLFSSMKYTIETAQVIRECEELKIRNLDKLTTGKSQQEISSTLIEESKKTEAEINHRIQEVIKKSYDDWPINPDAIILLTPMFMSFREVAPKLPKKILLSILPHFFKTALESPKPLFVDAGNLHETAYDRLMKIKKIKLDKVKEMLSEKEIKNYLKDPSFIGWLTQLKNQKLLANPEKFTIPKAYAFLEQKEKFGKGTKYKYKHLLLYLLPKEFKKLKEDYKQQIKSKKIFTSGKNKKIFTKGISIFDTEAFFEEFYASSMPREYLKIIKKFHSESLSQIYNIPKLYYYSDDDHVARIRDNIKRYREYPKIFGNSEVIFMRGLGHNVFHKDSLGAIGKKGVEAFLNNQVHFLKYHF